MLLLCLFVMSFWNDMLILIIVRGMYWHYTFYKNTESFMFYQL